MKSELQLTQAALKASLKYINKVDKHRAPHSREEVARENLFITVSELEEFKSSQGKQPPVITLTRELGYKLLETAKFAALSTPNITVRENINREVEQLQQALNQKGTPQ